MYRFQRQYLGPVQAVIFDWAGTVVDYGSFAPTQVLMDAFAGFGVDVSLEEARQPMGLPKREHIRALGRTLRREPAGPVREALEALAGAASR